jgi:hypothetical protein
VILTTDGLLDNLFDSDVRALLARLDVTPCHQLARLKKQRCAELQAVATELEAEAAGQKRKTALEKRKILGVAPTVVTDALIAGKERECRAVLRSIAALLAVTAQRVGNDEKAHSPFAAATQAAHKAGMKDVYRRPIQPYVGGKLDDVAVVAAVVVPDDSPAAAAAAAAAAAKRSGVSEIGSSSAATSKAA